MIAIKTEAGQRVLKDRSITLLPRQRSAFILFDGKRTVNDVLLATAAMGVTPEDIAQLMDLGLLEEAPKSGGSGSAPSASGTSMGVGVAPASAPAPVSSGRTAQQRYQEAYPIATRLTAGLGLRGFRLNLAIEGASSYDQLLELLPKIREAVGAERCAVLERALRD